MSTKIVRATQLQFGSGAGTNTMAEFGSLFASYPTVPTRYSGSSITPALVQALSNYLTGWTGAAVGSNSPAIEDMNSVCFLYAYQLGYILSQGVAEWDAATPYFKGAIVSANLFTFTISSASATAGATYTDSSSGFTFTVLATISSTTTIHMSGPGSPGASGTLTKVSGTGSSTLTYSASIFDGNVQYQSRTDSNLGNVVTNATNWTWVEGKVVTTSSSGNVNPGVVLIVVSATQTQTLPDATICQGQAFEFVKSDSNATTVTFNTVSSQTISGQASGVVTLVQQYSFYRFRSDGSNWWIVSAG